MTTPDSVGLPEHVRENRRYWDDCVDDWAAAGRRAWESAEASWGAWGLPESELRLLPGDMKGMRAIELGCGTGYVAGWLVRRGARVVGIDNSARQLESAQRFAEEFGADLALIHANAEAVPCPDALFDFAISEYGAAIWCDPYAWIPEAHRLLREGGELVFLATTPLAMMTIPDDGSPSDTGLHRPYFGLHRLDWREVDVDPGGIEFTLPISTWLKLFRATGFEILDYLELRAPESLEGNFFGAPAEWGKRWPYEHVWKLRKRSCDNDSKPLKSSVNRRTKQRSSLSSEEQRKRGWNRAESRRGRNGPHRSWSVTSRRSPDGDGPRPRLDGGRPSRRHHQGGDTGHGGDGLRAGARHHRE